MGPLLGQSLVMTARAGRQTIGETRLLSFRKIRAQAYASNKE